MLETWHGRGDARILESCTPIPIQDKEQEEDGGDSR
jgi:hypothetical protein